MKDISLKKFIELNELDYETLWDEDYLKEVMTDLVEKGKWEDLRAFATTLENWPDCEYYVFDGDRLHAIETYEDIIQALPNEDFKPPEPEAEISL